MADTTLTGLTAVASVGGTDTIYVNQAGSKKATVAQFLSYVNTNIATNISNVSGLQTALDGKASTTHTHIISDVTGLQTALDGKASTSHTHTASQVTDFSEAVDDRVATLLTAGTNITLTYNDAAGTLTVAAGGGGGLTTEDVQDVVGTMVIGGTGLTATYDDVGGTLTIDRDSLAISDVTGLQTALDGKASSSHTHTASQVTDFSEAVDDRVAALLTAGTNVTLTYNDAAGTLTVDAAGGGSGSPGGSDSQIQYNNGGAFGGDSAFTFDDTRKSVTLAGGTVTTAGNLATLSQTWNNGSAVFYGMKIDITTTAWDDGSSLALCVNEDGTNKFGVKPGGQVWATSEYKISSTPSGQATSYVGSGFFKVLNSGYFGFSPNTNAASASDIGLMRDAANVLAVRNPGSTTSPTTLVVTGTYTSSTNYEQLAFVTSASNYQIKSQKGTTGSYRPILKDFYESASDPTTTDIPAGMTGVWKNTTSGVVKLWANNAGTMVGVALA